VFCAQESVCRSRSRTGRSAATTLYRHDHFPEEDRPARERRRSRKGRGKKGKGKKKKMERTLVRQPYINTKRSIPYLNGKFMR